jgi:hypothetical protein
MSAVVAVFFVSSLSLAQSSTFGPPRTKAELEQETRLILVEIVSCVCPSNPELTEDIYRRQQAWLRLKQLLKEGASEDLIRASAKELADADRKVLDLELELVQKHLPKDTLEPNRFVGHYKWFRNRGCGSQRELSAPWLLELLKTADPRYRELLEEIDRLQDRRRKLDASKKEAHEIVRRLEAAEKEVHERRVTFLRKGLEFVNADPETDRIVAKYNK